ncbi:O-methyltransferase-domain-containing protein [Sparassis latifolia]|uniref:O-methyltransferase tpcA n=1 Tax=Sparassis crispa TaxID=139825 RepID=A0A401GR67_9APHY|nr:O-methyltransferase tpcA [Sparassis crispa]GBE84214.1 O-methyltransferase tpcA [Sparassis crispa]
MSTTGARAEKLLAVVDLVTNAAQAIIKEWAKEDAASGQNALPSVDLFKAQRTILAACGSFTELVQVPQKRVIEVAAQFFEARALHIAVEHRVAHHLAKVDQAVGMSITELSKATGLHPKKLSRIVRALCSMHIFAEVQDGYFANNTVSETLATDEALEAYVLLMASDYYSVSDKLLKIIGDPVKGWSNSVTDSAFQEGHGTKLSFWDWLEEGVVQPDGSVKPRPSLERFTLSMVNASRLIGTPPFYDFPWESFGSATMVDVGGGVGGMSFDLCNHFPLLNFIVQDRPAIIEKAEPVWQRERPEAHKAGRVKFMAHDFFTENPVKGADVYLLRHILHDWEDDRCVDILSAIRPALSANSRVLIVDSVMNTTLGCPELPSAPFPLPANYGTSIRLAHQLDLIMMSLFNGAERVPSDFRSLAQRAGLEVTRIWECPGDCITEMRLPSGKQ